MSADRPTFLQWPLLLATLFSLIAVPSAPAVQVQDLVRLKGSETNKLVGMGLVVGLTGTGDGGKFLPAMRPLATLTQQLIDPNTVTAEMKDAKNVALVAITATLPAVGVREGDRVDVQVSAIGPAKSLAGGRLFLIPMTGPVPGSPVYAFAEGALLLEDPKTPTVAVVKGGAQLTRDVMTRSLDDRGRATLVLNDAVASWPLANNIANLINGVMSPDGPGIARALDAKNVQVQLPPYEQGDPAAFISQMLQSYIDPSQINAAAKVVINERTGTIIVSGDVYIAPVLIAHKGLVITSLTPAPQPTAQNPKIEQKTFVPMDPDRRGGANLLDLMSALNQLKVEPADRIAILKELHRSGKLFAQLIIE